MLAAIGVVGGGDAAYAFGVHQQVERLAPDHLVDVQFLVAGLADEPHDVLGAREGAVALADAQIVLAVAHRIHDVRPVHDGKVARLVARGAELAQHRIGEGVKGAALHPGDPVHPAVDGGGGAVLQQPPGPVQHFARGLAGEGQQQDGGGGHALLHQIGQPVDDGARLAAPRTGNDQHRAFQGGGGLILGGVQFVSIIYHVFVGCLSVRLR